MKNFIEELKWRGNFHQATPGTEEALQKEMMKGYIGFDPTAPSLTIGNYVQIMTLTVFQMCGHQPIVLMGGATGRIGDPSGKDQERTLLDYETLDSNLNYQAELMAKLLNFEDGENKALLVNNYDFYKNMNVLDFLRDVGKNLTINYMTNKESVKSRMETGISYTEFSYQLLQAYDFQCLYEKHGCKIQMGGSDQWGNITAGTHLIGKNIKDAEVHGVTTPLLTKSDGKKFGKSEKGNIWIDPKLTSPYQFYQFWINATDEDIFKFNRLFTLKDHAEVEDMEKEHKENPHLRILQKSLAEEMTKRIHNDEAYDGALGVSNLLFNKKANKEALLSLSEESMKSIAGEIPSFSISKDQVANGINIIDLMTEATQIVASKSDARRAIKGQSVSVNKDKVPSHELTVTSEHLIHGKYMMVENGKKNKFLLVAK